MMLAAEVVSRAVLSFELLMNAFSFLGRPPLGVIMVHIAWGVCADREEEGWCLRKERSRSTISIQSPLQGMFWITLTAFLNQPHPLPCSSPSIPHFAAFTLVTCPARRQLHSVSPNGPGVAGTRLVGGKGRGGFWA